jgi:hypothetical protein
MTTALSQPIITPNSEIPTQTNPTSMSLNCLVEVGPTVGHEELTNMQPGYIFWLQQTHATGLFADGYGLRFDGNGGLNIIRRPSTNDNGTFEPTKKIMDDSIIYIITDTDAHPELRTPLHNESKVFTATITGKNAIIDGSCLVTNKYLNLQRENTSSHFRLVLTIKLSYFKI